MPEESRPEYIPPPVWQFYQELREPNDNGSPSPLERSPTREAVRRLLGLECGRDDLDRHGRPKIAITWRHLQRAIEQDPRSPFERWKPTAADADNWRAMREDFRQHGATWWQVMDYRHLFDLLWSLPSTFDNGAYQARRRARELVQGSTNKATPTIAELAYQLADALTEYRTIAERRHLSEPIEGRLTEAWIETAVRAQPDPIDRYRFERETLPHFGWGYGFADVRWLPNPALMLETLAVAFEGFEPTASPVFADYANTEQEPGKTAIVRHFERAWCNFQACNRGDMRPPNVMAARFTIGDTDLSRILSALFGFPFTRENIKDTRAAIASSPR